jgi:DNA-directed RNA polymerase subunit RPC12/RpoP
MELVTVQRLNTSIDAHLMQNVLEGEGIVSFIQDEHTVDMNALFSNAIGGVRLQVRPEDVQRALEVIDRHNHKPFLDKNGEEIACPQCQSTRLFSDFNSMKNAGSIFAAFVSILFSAFPIYRKRVYRCKECECEFEPAK